MDVCNDILRHLVVLMTYIAVSSSEDISGVDQVAATGPPVVEPQISDLSTPVQRFMMLLTPAFLR